MHTLLASLSDHSMAMLRGIADMRGLELSTNNRDDAAAQLATALAEPDATAAALAACSTGGRAAWQALAAARGKLKTPVFSRHHGAIRPVGPARLEREAVWLQPQSSAEELWYRGLIFRGFADLGDGAAEYIYIPPELLPAPLPAAAHAPATILPAAPAPPGKRQTFNTLAVDVCALLAALRETPLHTDSAGKPRGAELARLREGLLLPDSIRLDLALTLARGQGWLAVDRDRLALNSQAATGWLRLTPWEQMRGLFIAWRESADAGPANSAGWNDLRRVPALQAEGAWRNDPLAARRAILEVLGQLAVGAWHTINDLTGWIKAANPDFQRPDGAYTGWYLRDIETGRYLSGFESWDEVEGRLIRFLVTGPLFWLGALALGEAVDGAPQAFCLTEFGAAWLGRPLARDLPRPARLSIDDQFVITAPLLLPLLDRFRLLRFTEPGAESSELGRPTRHRITRGGLARARAGGVAAPAIVEFLQRASGGHVPPRVAAALARWDQHGGAVRITRGAVLRVADANILAALRADPAVAAALGDLLSAQAAIVPEADLPKLLQALDELGYTVKAE
ncbi:MAG: Helicase 3 protein [Chloroflexota bacterium]|nr:Helicase 3 protein [Chloroflexota bacterium]